MTRILYILSLILVLLGQFVPAIGQPAHDGGNPIIRFYPNPATTFVTFDFQKSYDRGYAIQVYSFLGKRVFDATNLGPKTTINLTDFNRGIYIYQLYDRNGKLVESGKFQVSK